MIKYNDYYFHGCGGFLGNKNASFKLLKIYETGEIKTHSDLVYLCDTSKPKVKVNDKYLKSAFDTLIKCAPSLAIKKDNLEVVTPISYEPHNSYDEVWCEKSIPVSLVEFITFPIASYSDIKLLYSNLYENQNIINNYYMDLQLYEYQIRTMRNLYPQIPIINLYTGQYIDEERIKELISVLEKEKSQ